jgi:hypothetical protein
MAKSSTIKLIWRNNMKKFRNYLILCMMIAVFIIPMTSASASTTCTATPSNCSIVADKSFALPNLNGITKLEATDYWRTVATVGTESGTVAYVMVSDQGTQYQYFQTGIWQVNQVSGNTGIWYWSEGSSSATTYTQKFSTTGVVQNTTHVFKVEKSAGSWTGYIDGSAVFGWNYVTSSKYNTVDLGEEIVSATGHAQKSAFNGTIANHSYMSNITIVNEGNVMPAQTYTPLVDTNGNFSQVGGTLYFWDSRY